MNTNDQIIKTAKEMLPLYSQQEADLPDRPLWAHPEIDRVIEVLRVVADILFPGKSNPEPKDFEVFFVQQMENAAAILLPEIEKALPFRWMSAADLHENRPSIDDIYETSTEIVNHFISAIPHVRKMLIEDVQAAYNGDPAALSYAEVKLAYPGLVAITSPASPMCSTGSTCR